MKILFVSPKMPPTLYTFDTAVAIAGKKACYPPQGLLTVAALLPKEWEKRLIDINVRELEDEAILWADFVFIGAMNNQVQSAREVVARCRQLGVKTVAGGPLFTHEHETFTEVDHFVLNEAEITLPMFLADLETGNLKPLYSTEEFADVSKTPIPMWELIDLSDYLFAIVQYSRGCPYLCDFCDVTALFGRRPRTKSPEQMIAELEALGDLNRFDLVLFADDNLIGNKVDLKNNLLPALIDWRIRTKPPVTFATQVTINLVDDPVLTDLMFKAGFRTIFTGIETPEQDTLIASQKKQNSKRDLLENVRKLHESGFIVSAGFIVGFDTDTKERFQRLIDFIQESGIVNSTVNLLKAPPGTELYARMRKEGRLIEPFNFAENESNVVPVMPPRDLYEGFDIVLRDVYTTRRMFERGKTFLKSYRLPVTLHRRKRGIRFRDIKTLFRILYRIGLVEPERGEFWKFLAWTLYHHPSKIRIFFLHATMALQYRKVYERYEPEVAIRNMEKALADRASYTTSEAAAA